MTETTTPAPVNQDEELTPTIDCAGQLESFLRGNSENLNKRLNTIRSEKDSIRRRYSQLELDEQNTLISLKAAHAALGELEEPS